MSADRRSAWSLAMLGLLAVLTFGACHERAPSYTAIYVAIDADAYVRQRAASFRVKTARDELVLKVADRSLPLFVTVEPGEGESGTRGEISVTALDAAGAIIVRREAVLTLVDGKQRRVEVLLTRFCAESYEACEAAGLSCDGCACTERKIAAADLSVVDVAAPLAGVTAPSVCAEGAGTREGMDAAVDASAVGRSDSGVDAAVDATDARGTSDASVCACEGTELCVPERRECVDFCAVPEDLPHQDPLPDIFCGGEKDLTTPNPDDVIVLDFATTCQNTCLLTCRWQNWFCEADRNCAIECAATDVQTACTAGCGAEGDPGACQQAACVAARSRTCEENASLCPGGAFTPDCSEVACSNECANRPTDNLNRFDGYCDDGAFAESATDFCPYGTDCADCGPRPLVPSALDTSDDLAIGELCANNWRCPLHSSDHLFNESWCVAVVPGVYRCVLDCSRNDELCPSGFSCMSLVNSEGAPLRDDKGQSAWACVPADEKLCE